MSHVSKHRLKDLLTLLGGLEHRDLRPNPCQSKISTLRCITLVPIDRPAPAGSSCASQWTVRPTAIERTLSQQRSINLYSGI